MLDVLAFGAHPDDVEFGCGGIIAKLTAEKKRVAIVNLTLGDKGTNGTPAIRKKEAKAAAQVLGAECYFLDFKDCEVIDTYEGRLTLTQVIRKLRPKLVLAPSESSAQNHPDHSACAKMVRFASRYARFAKLLPDLAPHFVQGVLHYSVPGLGEVDFLVDISKHVSVWKEAMLCHKSQMKTFDYLNWQLRAASQKGGLFGVEYAQGLTKQNPVVVDDILNVAQGIREI